MNHDDDHNHDHEDHKDHEDQILSINRDLSSAFARKDVCVLIVFMSTSNLCRYCLMLIAVVLKFWLKFLVFENSGGSMDNIARAGE